MNNNNSLMLGHFLPSSLIQQSTSIRRLTSTSSDSGDSGVDPSYRQERKIFVGGVPSSVGPEELANFFQTYGQVEEAFIIYDRYSGRHRGFGFVTFADMTSTKHVCSTRIFNLHGRKIECKRALKREEILGHHDNDNNECKSFRPNDIDRSPSSPPLISDTSPTPISMCPTSMPIPNYSQYRSTSTNSSNGGGNGPMINTLPTGWIVNPSLPPIFHPMLNSTQPFAVFSLPTIMWNNPYQQPPTTTMPYPFIQDVIIPTTSPQMMTL